MSRGSPKHRRTSKCSADVAVVKGNGERGREEAPITDQAALEVQSHFQVQGLFEHVARGRKRAVGAMFPHLEFTQPR